MPGDGDVIHFLRIDLRLLPLLEIDRSRKRLKQHELGKGHVSGLRQRYGRIEGLSCIGGKTKDERAEDVHAVLTEDLQADVQRERDDILSRAAQKMRDIVKKLAEEKGVDVVVDIGNTVYFKPALEITTESIAAYDKANPAK